MNIIIIEGEDLASLLRQFSGDPATIRRVRISLDGGGVLVKVNENGWTRPLGRKENAHG